MSDDSRVALRAVMRRFWRHIIVMLVIQTIVIAALVKLLPAIPL